jgi:hypothetical protein
MRIVRIRCHLKLDASAVRLAEGDLTQRGNDPFAEDEPDGLGGLREMTVRRRCRAEKGGVQQHTRRGARDSRAPGKKDNDGNRSEHTAPIEG